MRIDSLVENWQNAQEEAPALRLAAEETGHLSEARSAIAGVRFHSQADKMISGWLIQQTGSVVLNRPYVSVLTWIS